MSDLSSFVFQMTFVISIEFDQIQYTIYSILIISKLWCDNKKVKNVDSIRNIYPKHSENTSYQCLCWMLWMRGQNQCALWADLTQAGETFLGDDAWRRWVLQQLQTPRITTGPVFSRPRWGIMSLPPDKKRERKRKVNKCIF